MRRAIIAATVVALSVGGVAVADDEDIVPVSVLPGEGLRAVARRLCPNDATAGYWSLLRANPWAADTGLDPGTVLQWDPTTCPPTTPTTEVTTSSTSAPSPSTTSPTTSTAPPTSTSGPTSTLSPTTVPSPSSSSTTSAPGTPSGFTASFQTALDLDRFDFQLHTSSNGVPCSQNPSPSAGCIPLEPAFHGEHNLACQGPTTLRDIVGGQTSGTDVDGLVYHCAPGGSDTGHFMTVVDTGAVAVLSFAPDQTFNNVRRVCWDQNVNNLGEGKWTNVHIVPEAVFQANGGAMHYVNGQGFGLDPSEITAPVGVLTLTHLRGSFQAWQGNGNGGTRVMWEGGPNDMDVSSAPRYRHCVEDIAGPNLRFTIARPNGQVQTFDRAGTLPQGPARVIFQDGSYNPSKHNGTVHLTWHWDNLTVEV